MRPEYKSNIKTTLDNYRHWWNDKHLARPLLQIYAPRKGVISDHSYNEWVTLAHNLDNPDKAFEEFEKYCQQTYFGGEAIPRFWVNLGPGVIATYLGCELKIKKETIWIEERGDLSWDEILNLQFDQNDKWWQLTKKLTRKAGRYSSGKYFTSITDLNGTLNILASLRGTQNLSTDLIKNPKVVKKACEKILDIWFQCYDELYQICSRYQPGSITWMGVWFPGRGSDLQSDFSAMISPDMFQEFVIPDIKKQSRYLDQTIYHLDGPGQLVHVKHLLEI
ncbi:MAG: hypothetical protein K9M80_05395 [Candidatus Marinimicrobia bacterium]|nr:hypothetical protein [Candidatus Neomarinimicrobiota bacterium]